MEKCIIFDFAFTLVSHHFDVYSAFSKAYKTYLKSGIPQDVIEKYDDPRDETPDIVSMIVGVYDWMTEYLPIDRADKIQIKVSKIIESFEMKAVENAKPLPGCEDTLKIIRERGLKTGIVSANCRRFILEVLRKMSLVKYFDAVVTRDSPGKMKPHPDHLLRCLNLLRCDSKDAIFVGDEVRDMLCAKNVGVLGVGVLTGWRIEEGLKERADEVISNLSELPLLLKDLSWM